jgi:integrase
LVGGCAELKPPNTSLSTEDLAKPRHARHRTRSARRADNTKSQHHRAVITDPKELGALLRAIEDYSCQPTTRLALRLSALLFVRPGELRLARWKEIDFEKPVWTVPAEMMKMKRPHRVPLSRQAIVIFREPYGMTGQGEYRTSRRSRSLTCWRSMRTTDRICPWETPRRRSVFAAESCVSMTGGAQRCFQILRARNAGGM